MSSLGKCKLLICVIILTLPIPYVYSQEPIEIKPASYEIIDEHLKGYYSQVVGIDTGYIFNTDLYITVESWLGTPYRYAGNSMKGIDCSAFVANVYKNVYSALVFGNSLSFYKSSEPVTKNDLREGDLVFFKINRNKIVSHVGVFLGNNKFAHASRSSGVVISDLENPYYKKYFLRGGRLLTTTQ